MKKKDCNIDTKMLW